MEYINRAYGSKIGLLRLMRSRVVQSLGGYNMLFNIDFNNVERLVFVCKGNICRSAYAEAYARWLGLHAVSCGIEAAENRLADMRAVQHGRSRGISLESHRTRHISTMTFGSTDLLLGMEPSHLLSMRKVAAGAQVTLLGMWAPEAPRPYLHDPYTAPDSYFDTCFDFIERCVVALKNRDCTSGAISCGQVR